MNDLADLCLKLEATIINRLDSARSAIVESEMMTPPEARTAEAMRARLLDESAKVLCQALAVLRAIK